MSSSRRDEQKAETMRTKVETCANCGATIGRLEQARLWQDNVVCARCHERLAPAQVPPPGMSRSPGRDVAETISPTFGVPDPADDEAERRPQSFFYGSVRLTPSQLSIGATTYPIRNIASVSTSSVMIRGKRLLWPGLLTVSFGIVALGFGLTARAGINRNLSEHAAYIQGERLRDMQADLAVMGGIAIVGAFVTAAGVWLLFTLGRKKDPDRPMFTVTITANSGETYHVQFGDGREVVRLVNELRAAIARAGARPPRADGARR